MAIREIYIVRGETGEYSDRTEWLVMAYTSHIMATAHCHAANAWAWEHRVAHTGDAYMNYEDQKKAQQAGNPYDPHMSILYTGVSYTVIDVPLNDTYEDAEAGRNDSP